MNEPVELLRRQFLERAMPWVREMREQGWPVEATAVFTEDKRNLVVLSVEFPPLAPPKPFHLTSESES